MQFILCCSKTDRGKSKELVVHAYKINNQEIYSYSRSEERFEPPVKTVYKVTLHIIYREGNRVKKKQYRICNIGYYDLVVDRINQLSQELNIPSNEIYELICC